MKLKRILNYFSKFELTLWISSLVVISVSFFAFDGTSYLSYVASLVGATSLIFCAKGNPIGQVLIIIFSILYGIISYSAAYYGEMLTYMCMSAPMAIYALVSWIRNPYAKGSSEVKVNRVGGREMIFLVFLTAAVTVVFYFVLKHFNTANLLTSTFSVTTSFFAVYLTARRSPYYAVAYAFNDIVLIVLWIMATVKDISYLSVIICFFVFLANDIYSFYNWRKMSKRQAENK